MTTMKKIMFKKIEIKLYKDGNRWCCMSGKDIQEGISGFGKTKGIAIANYCKETGYDLIQQYAIREQFGFKMV